MIKVLFFAQLSELAGRDFVDFENSLPISINDLVKQLSKLMPQTLVESQHDEAVMVSINQTIAARDELVHEGDEVAFLPPFSGG